MHNRYAKLDQDNLQEMVNKWEESLPRDHFSLSLATVARTEDDDYVNLPDIDDEDTDDLPVLENTEDSSSFFFCHQTEYQRHLLHR